MIAKVEADREANPPITTEWMTEWVLARKAEGWKATDFHRHFAEREVLARSVENAGARIVELEQQVDELKNQQAKVAAEMRAWVTVLTSWSEN